MADPSPSSALPPLRIMMAAGEVSGDMYGGALIRALRRRFPGRQLEICGIGGDAMRAEGAELLYHTDDLGAMGLTDVLKKLGFFKRVLRELVERAAEWKPDALVTLDYYSFNIALAERVHALGVELTQLHDVGAVDDDDDVLEVLHRVVDTLLKGPLFLCERRRHRQQHPTY